MHHVALGGADGRRLARRDDAAVPRGFSRLVSACGKSVPSSASRKVDIGGHLQVDQNLVEVQALLHHREPHTLAVRTPSIAIPEQHQPI
eukprot:3104896-Rhodomonas_salina.3